MLRGAQPAARRHVSRALSRHLARNKSALAALPEYADVVVIGGGSIGASVAYHAQQRGLSTVLLEKHQLTSGTTWHSAAMLWRLQRADSDIEMHSYTREKCIALEEETGVPSWTENGGLFVAGNEERLDEFKRLTTLGKYFGIESHVLAPSEIQDVHPLISPEGSVGGIYSPTDGTIDPTGIVTAYAKAARKRGAVIAEGVGVAGLELEDACSFGSAAGAAGAKQLTAVVTTTGERIRAGAVVNACGSWGRQVAGLAGSQLPLMTMKHAFVVTGTIEGMKPSYPNVRDQDLSVYLKAQGDAMAVGGYEQNPDFWHDVSPDFSFGLFDLDWDTFSQNLEGHLIRCPAVAEAGVKSTVCGPESFTPDHKPLVGPDPNGVRGLWHACGFNSMGMMLGGGIGRELAAWIDTGSPDLDLFGFDPARFHPDTVSSPRWVADRTHESYAKTYAVVFPHDEPLAGRGLRYSALHDRLLANGCVYQSRHGHERPGHFERALAVADGEEEERPARVKPYDYYGAYVSAKETSPVMLEAPVAAADAGDGAGMLEDAVFGGEAPAHDSHTYHELVDAECTFGWGGAFAAVADECLATRSGVGIYDQSYFGKFEVSGADAAPFVSWLCAAPVLVDVRSGEPKPVGTVTYTPLLNDRGGVEADLTVTRLADDAFYFAAGGATATKDLAHIRRAAGDFARMRGGGEGGADLDVRVEDVSSDYCILSLQGPYSRALLQPLITSGHTLDDGAFPFSTGQEVEIAGCARVRCLRLTFVGELGWELHVPSESAVAVYDLVKAAGAGLRHTAELAGACPPGLRAAAAAAGAGAAKGAPVLVRDCGYRAIDSLSADKNYRHWHADVSGRDTPVEAAIGFTVLPRLKNTTADESPFIGRAALERRREEGRPRRKLVCLAVGSAGRRDEGGGPGSPPPLHSNETIWRDGVCVGYVRSAAYSHTLGASLVYGYIDLDCHGTALAAEEGGAETPVKITNKWLKAGEYEVEDRGVRHAATLHVGAPFDGKNTRIKGQYAQDDLGVLVTKPLQGEGTITKKEEAAAVDTKVVKQAVLLSEFAEPAETAVKQAVLLSEFAELADAAEPAEAAVAAPRDELVSPPPVQSQHVRSFSILRKWPGEK